MKKLEIGDPVLVTGFGHFEKAKVVSIKKGLILLDNNMQIDRSFNNVTRSQMKAQAWDEDEYNFLKAKTLMRQELSAIQRNWNNLGKEETIALYNKLSKIVDKYSFNRL